MRGANTAASGRSVSASLNEAETSSLLHEVVRVFKTQTHEVLLGAVARAISEWAGERTVLVDVEGHGREEVVKDVDLTRTVGWFTSLYPVRMEVNGGNSVELLRDVKEQIREASRRGVYYGMLRYLSEEPDLRERFRAMSQAEISFNYLGQLDLVLKEDALFRGARESAGETRSLKEKRRHLIEINGSVRGGRLHLTWTYSENAHRRETIESMAERTMEALRDIVARSKSTTERPYTPSDFPLATLDRQRLDRLVRANKDLEDIYALSPLQKAMLFHTLSGINSQALFLQLTCDLRGGVDLSAFKKAWRRLVDRHPILRTSFEWKEIDDPVQVVHRRAELPIEYRDWGAMTGEEQERRFELLVQTDRERGFDLSNPPLIRLSLIRLGEDLYRLIWSQHHLLVDGWSSPLILKEVFAFYEAYREGDELVMEERSPYKEYIRWLSQQDFQRAEAYWRERLKGFRRPTKLWIDRGSGRPTSREEEFEDHHVKISKEATAKLQTFARERHLTMNTILQGAWGIVLGKYSGEDDIAFGTTVSGRPVDLPGSESIIGPFINTLPIRIQIPLQSSLLSWLSIIQNEQLEYSRYAYSSMAERFSEIPLGMPLFESILIFENYPVEQPSHGLGRQLEISGVRSQTRTKYPLTIVSRPASELPLTIAYDLRRFDGPDISRLLAHFRNVLEGMVNSPERPIWSISLLSRTEQEQLLVSWQGRRRSDSDDLYIHHRLESQAEKTPDAISVVFGEEELTYRELNSRADQLAAHLQALGIGPEARVGIHMEPSPSLLVGLLGVLKAGGVCVPFGAADCEERFASRLSVQDFGVSVLLTQRLLAEKNIEIGTEIVRLDSDWEMISSRSGTNPHSHVAGENLAFITYTSGSTGNPKPAMITHRGLRDHLINRQEVFGLHNEDRILQKIGFSPNVSMLEVFEPLLAGARLVIAGPEAYQNRDHLVGLIAMQRITTAGFAPSIFSLLLREEGFGKCSPLKRIIFTGEKLCRSTQDRASACLDADLYNVYCVTEASGAVTTQVCLPRLSGEVVPVGQPTTNTQIYILDSHLQPVPVGVVGNVWISGEVLARGYADRQDFTAEKFMPHPFSEDLGMRMFKTEDLARWLPEGKIEVLAHNDHQIITKFGHLEPAALEAAMMEYEGIDHAVVLLSGEAFGSPHLAAYLTYNTESAPSVDALRRFLRERFPAQGVPSAFLTMKTPPLTVNDRVDRKALAQMELKVTDAEMELANKSNPYEEMLCAIWNELFGTDVVGREDNFFEMGGHSLLATRMMSRIRDVFKIEIALSSVFEEPTIEGLARRIEKAIKADEKVEAPPLVKASRDGRRAARPPLSFAQQRLWFLDQLVPNNPFYNCPGAVGLEGRLDLDALERSVNEIVRRHAALRTRIEVEEGQPVQVIEDWAPRSLEVEDLSRLEAGEREEVVRRITREEAAMGFDLSKGPLIRVKALKLGQDRHVMLFTMHHIVCDGWSIGILIREVGQLYKAYSAGAESPLEELPIQYADFAAWQGAWLQGEALEKELAYWRGQLAGMEEMELPTDHPRSAGQSRRGARRRFVVERELAEKLKSLSRREGVTLFMTLMGAFVVVMSRYSGQQEAVVGTDIANRNRAEIEGLIGFFVNQLVIRVGVRDRESFKELLGRVKEVCLGAYGRQELPFEKLVEELQPERDLSRSPLFQVKLILQNAPREELELEGLRLLGVDSGDVETARMDLTLAFMDAGHDLVGAVNYNRDLFEEGTIERLIGHYTNALRWIAPGVLEEGDERPISELSLLSDGEREQIIVEWNQTGRPYPKDRRVHELFREQAERTPERIALIGGGEQVSYRELNRRANQLGRYLQRLGVGPDVVVGLCLERSAEMVIALMGVLKAGGAYLPLDPSYPLERLGYMLEDAGVGVVITTQELERRLPAHWGQTVWLDLEWEKVSEEDEGEPEGGTLGENLAYVIYTSGSTGKPKGVMVRHKGLVNYTNYICQRLGVGGHEGLKFATVSTITADLGNTCIYPSLLGGGCLHVLSYEVATDGARFEEYLRRNPIDVLKIVPSHLSALLGLQPKGVRMLPWKYLILGGEALPYDLIERIGERGEGCEVINHYGPTETTIGSVTMSVSKQEEKGKRTTTAPIGRPIANTGAYVLDRHLKPVPAGVRGDLYI